MTTTTATTVQVHRVYIKASAQAVWDAIVDPEWNRRYGYHTPCTYDLRKGGAYRVAASPEMIAHGAPDVILTGEVLEFDPPRKLVQTCHPHFSPDLDAEGARTVTWDIEESFPGIVRLTLSHDVTDAPLTAEHVNGDVPNAGGGWPMIIS